MNLHKLLTQRVSDGAEGDRDVRDVWLKSPIHNNLLGLARAHLVDLQDKTGEVVFLAHAGAAARTWSMSITSRAAS